eukprot:symbB.v1.2.037579.t1/scaffold5592.1/size25535/1
MTGAQPYGLLQRKWPLTEMSRIEKPTLARSAVERSDCGVLTATINILAGPLISASRVDITGASVRLRRKDQKGKCFECFPRAGEWA